MAVRDKQLQEAYINSDGSRPFAADQSMGGHKLRSILAPTASDDAARKAEVDALAAGIRWKEPVRAATIGNITLSGTQTIDGVVLIADDRCLVKGQTDPTENGIYDVKSGAPWVRSDDADTGAKIEHAAVFVEEGTQEDRAFVMNQDPPVTIGVSSITWVQFTGFESPAWTRLDKELTPNATSGDGEDTGITISRTPAGDSYVKVEVNGFAYTVGDGVKTKECYFSRDGGTTALGIADVQVGDTLYWNGVVAGFDLLGADQVDLYYDVTT